MSRIITADVSVLRRRNLRNDYYSLTLGPFAGSKSCRPGSFVHLLLPDSSVFFRRAMSVAAVDPPNQELEIVFRVVGRGTAFLAGCSRGSRLDVLGPLGNGFKLPPKSATTIIVAGGIGFPPLLYLATDMVKRGYDPKRIHFFYGGRGAGDIIERTRLRRLGVLFHPVTDDGSTGRKGLVTEIVEEHISEHRPEQMRMYACGPEPMLRATDTLGRKYGLKGELSLEAPMPCGIGVCLGCVVPLRIGGHARVCREGPVFGIGEVLL